MSRRLLAFVLSAVALAAALAGAPPFGVPPASAATCADPGQDFKPVPWQQQMLSPNRVWPLTRGGGRTVAVLDSGVDGAHARLSGHVAAGWDAIAGAGAANTDCVGTGTQIAGVIAGQPSTTSGFAGLAPGVTVLPVRVVNQRALSGASPTSPAVLAKAINWAVAANVDVIDVSVPSYVDDPVLRAAVANALAKQIVVVAAAGDLGGPNGGNPTPYPAAYPGVLGVGAIDEAGARWQSSQVGSYVDLVAPGASVVTLQRGTGMVAADGTGLASGFVSAAAALVRAQKGDISAAAIVRQLVATATPSSGDSAQYGDGIVNPEAAVSDQLVNTTARKLPPVSRPADAATSVWAKSREWALIGTVAAFGAALLAFAVAVALPRARRRRWRAGEQPPPNARPESEEPGPPVLLFD
jgi:membrane-anchored mycosin MYCP